jgi:hypothetical protein
VLDDAFKVASNGCGLHPKMAWQLNLIWKPLEKVGILAGPNTEEQSKEPGKIVMKILYLPTRL